MTLAQVVGWGLWQGVVCQLKEDRRGAENEPVDNVEPRGDKMCLELCHRRNNPRRTVLNGGYGVRKREIN